MSLNCLVPNYTLLVQVLYDRQKVSFVGLRKAQIVPYNDKREQFQSTKGNLFPLLRGGARTGDEGLVLKEQSMVDKCMGKATNQSFNQTLEIEGFLDEILYI